MRCHALSNYGCDAGGLWGGSVIETRNCEERKKRINIIELRYVMGDAEGQVA